MDDPSMIFEMEPELLDNIPLDSPPPRWDVEPIEAQDIENLVLSSAHEQGKN